MNDNHIEIKERRNSLLTKGVSYLLLSLISLSVALLPYIIIDLANNAIIFYLVGGVAFVVFATLFIFLLLKECKPESSLVLNSRGFVDKNNIGENIEIEWTNVSTVKLIGTTDTPFLGITLENADLVMVHMKKSLAVEMRENIEEGLPHILISQKEIRYPINDLKDLFVKFTREARALKNEASVKPKNNPFTTEDVLRAFGKLDNVIQNDADTKDEPSITDESSTTSIAKTNDNFASNDSTDNLLTNYDHKEIDNEILNESETVLNDNANEVKSVDSFYNLLFKESDTNNTLDEVITLQQNVNDVDEKNDHFIEELQSIEPEPNNTADSPFVVSAISEDDELSEEMKRLLANARSSRISELEKLLNEKDVPFSLARDINIVDEANATDNLQNTENKTKIVVQPEISAKETKSINNMGDTKEFYPEIVHFDD